MTAAQWVPLLKRVRSPINTRQYDSTLGQTTGRTWICTHMYWLGCISGTVANDDAPIIFPFSPQKTPLIEPRMNSVGAAVPENQLGLCRPGGKGIWFGARGTGVGAKRVSNRGLLRG